MRPGYPEDDVGRFAPAEDDPPRKRSGAVFWVVYVVAMASLGVVLALGWTGSITVPPNLIQTAVNLLPANNPITGPAPGSQPPTTTAQSDRQSGDAGMARELDQLRTGLGDISGSQKTTSASVDSLRQEVRALQDQLRAMQLELQKLGAAPTAHAWYSDPTTLTYRAPPIPKAAATAQRKAAPAKKTAAPKNDVPPPPDAR